MELKPSISEAVANLRAACIANVNWEVSYFDVKHLNEQEAYYRKRCLELISTYKEWMKLAGKQRDVRVMAYSELEGRALRTTMLEYLTVYKTIKLERKFLTDVYLRQIGVR